MVALCIPSGMFWADDSGLNDIFVGVLEVKVRVRRWKRLAIVG